MKLLLDAHAALWWLEAPERIGAAADRALADPTNQLLLSAASVWEIAIKRSIGKLEVPDDLVPTLLGGGVVPLSITLEHAAAVEALPFHHRDPFDRLLIAQATIERATLVTRDEAFRAYDVPVLW